MPTFKSGDMWSAYAGADLFLITTNATVKKNGALVMGRGIARQARDRFLGLDAALGKQILHACSNPPDALRSGQGQYGLLTSPRWPVARVGAFQVKMHYSKPASLFLIQRSVSALNDWCKAHPEATAVHLNFPGIENGGLPRRKVLPIIEQLSAVVTIWEYAPPKSADRIRSNLKL